MMVGLIYMIKNGEDGIIKREIISFLILCLYTKTVYVFVYKIYSRLVLASKKIDEPIN